MKLNWGTGIAIFYGLFVLALMGALIKSRTIQRSMVVDHYYEKDLNYKEKYNKIENSGQLAVKVKIIQNKDNGTVDIIFPPEVNEVKGEVLFYRPSSKGMDVNIPIENLEGNTLRIPLKQFKVGNWAVQVDWSSGGKDYFDKSNLYLQ